MTYAVLFPGQGSQTVGMCADVRALRTDLLGDLANEILGWDLDSLIENGPQDLLTETEHAQPALFATSYALYEEFMSVASTPPAAGAGHSLGEYTALAASGSLSYVDGLRLVAARGIAMAKCAAASSSGMAALLGAEAAAAEKIAADRRAGGGHLYVANLNAPGQIVVAGGTDDIDWIVENARELGVRRAVALDVAGGFHSPFMADAAHDLATALNETTFGSLSFDVYANSSARPTTDPAGTLHEQLTAPVRFAESLENIASSGVETFVHIGPGEVTAGLAKRTLKSADVRIVSDLEQAHTVAMEVSVQ